MTLSLLPARTFAPKVTRYRDKSGEKFDVYLMEDKEFQEIMAHTYFHRHETWELEGILWKVSLCTPLSFQLQNPKYQPLIFAGKQFFYYHRDFINPLDLLGEAPWIIEQAAIDGGMTLDHFMSLAKYQRSGHIGAAISKWLSNPKNAEAFHEMANKILIIPATVPA
jgi:hypothetical protein